MIRQIPSTETERVTFAEPLWLAEIKRDGAKTREAIGALAARVEALLAALDVPTAPQKSAPPAKR
jgi:hypothetical protein